MTGVILCGGQSSRMGTDKGLLKLQAATWAQTAVDKIAELHLPVLLSVNYEQYNSYSVVFAKDQLVKDIETINMRGPLRGVLSVHISYPAEDLFVLACDMPLMDANLLKDLFCHYEKHPADAYVYTNDGVHEPLCGIYSARGLSHILQLHQKDQLSKHSMKYMLEHIHTISIPLAPDQKKCFRNFNAHAELNGL